MKMGELEDSFELFAEYPDVEPVVADPLALPDFTDIRKELKISLEGQSRSYRRSPARKGATNCRRSSSRPAT